MGLDEPVLRVGTLDDETAADALMKESAAALFPRFYNEQQAASAVRYVAQVDSMLLTDGTYFVLESGNELVACGGWSRRDKLYTGSGDSEADARALDPSSEPARVRAMFVRADWTRRGLGRRILEECEAAAQPNRKVSGNSPLSPRCPACRCTSRTASSRSRRSRSLCPTASRSHACRWRSRSTSEVCARDRTVWWASDQRCRSKRTRARDAACDFDGLLRPRGRR